MKLRHELVADDALEEVQKMLYKMAWDHAQNYGVPFDECLSECHLGFVKAYYRYEPKRNAKFSSLVYIIARFRLLRLKKATRTGVVNKVSCAAFVEVDEEVAGHVRETHTDVHDVIAELSEDAQEVASLLLDTPWGIREELPTPKRLLRLVKDYLRQQNGWAKKRVKNAQRELQTALRESWA